jgi:hypothetical protein
VNLFFIRGTLLIRATTKILKYFDENSLFWLDDAIDFNLNFRPLFYLDSYNEIKKISGNKVKYDLLFLGTAHSDRYRITNCYKLV